MMSPRLPRPGADVSPAALRHLTPVVTLDYQSASTLNGPLAAAFAALTPEDFERRSHFVGGRFENLYLPPARLPGLAALVGFATASARTVLRLDPFWRGPAPEAGLRCGFWLNAMEPGHATSRHTHDENDELLSGVYYVSAPPGCGDLLIHDDPFEVRVPPVAGRLVLFPPELPHSVETNRSGERRLSIAFNFGPIPR